MATRLFAAIGCHPQRARCVVVGAAALLCLAGAITSLTVQRGPGREAGGLVVTAPTRARRPAAQPMPPRARPPVSQSKLRQPRRLAVRFLRSYLKFAYGRGSAGSVTGVSPGLGSQLIRDRAQVAPAERGRHPRVMSLATVGTTPGFVVATATIEDGGIAAYRLRFALRKVRDGWLVSDVQEG